ncbi:hypothetical protein COU89_01205 [Candidatus Roizmanbacteria bacterium CG10_big_fil_rev_8_21_14_0_10_45_7]|uniref:Glycosyltransferase RgtA/B/C/D-like domain-containing protein n=1 Tax=Candidatus Roizmanbacteria bacterium CG10_big_fil_rev_8_21_14_0_10_45_7 TaxID=1974854 RepID=A0A2M8KV76_9BACT|nr:MAG: hypothetical protein COU89_01205 [Candidatus Roizmanbacteria bacterium CG10_big_fil_rev_8_21_14_0_10_45_7]
MKKYILILIAIAFAATRFWQLDQRIIFDWDQEQFSNQIYDIITLNKFTLLGPRVTDDLGFFLAPYFTYILVPFYLLTNLDPSALIIFMVAINSLFFIASYKIISKMFSASHALGFLALWTFSSYHVKYDSIPWWPIYLPLGVVLVWYLLNRIRTKNRSLDWALLGGSLGFFSNMHFQFIVMGVFCGLYLFLMFRNNKTVVFAWTKAALAVGSFLIMFTPLLLFDLRHDFLNTNLMLGYFVRSGTATQKDMWVWREVFANTFIPYTYMRSVAVSLIIGAGLIWGAWWLGKNSTDKAKALFFTATAYLLILIPVIFAAYGKRPSEYYFMVFFPFITLVIAHLLVKLSKTIAVVLFVFYILGNMANIRYELVTNPQGLAAKKSIVMKIKERVGDNNYTISFDGPPNTDTGFKYLLKVRSMPYGLTENYSMIGVHIPAKPGDVVQQPYGITIPKQLLVK